MYSFVDHIEMLNTGLTLLQMTFISENGTACKRKPLFLSYLPFSLTYFFVTRLPENNVFVFLLSIIIFQLLVLLMSSIQNSKCAPDLSIPHLYNRGQINIKNENQQSWTMFECSLSFPHCDSICQVIWFISIQMENMILSPIIEVLKVLPYYSTHGEQQAPPVSRPNWPTGGRFDHT